MRDDGDDADDDPLAQLAQVLDEGHAGQAVSFAPRGRGGAVLAFLLVAAQADGDRGRPFGPGSPLVQRRVVGRRRQVGQSG